MRVYQALDLAIAHATRDEAAVVAARARFAERAGVVHDDEPLFEERATAFLEWLALDEADASGRTAASRLLDEIARRAADGSATRAPTPDAPGVAPLAAVDPGLAPALRAVATSHPSLFAVRERSSDGVLLDDLAGGATFRVGERRRLDGLEPGDLFQARIVADVDAPPRLAFSRAFSFHPREAAPAIRAAAARSRAAREPRTELLFRLLRLRVRCERYRHVPPARVYADGA